MPKVASVLGPALKLGMRDPAFGFVGNGVGFIVPPSRQPRLCRGLGFVSGCEAYFLYEHGTESEVCRPPRFENTPCCGLKFGSITKAPRYFHLNATY